MFLYTKTAEQKVANGIYEFTMKDKEGFRNLQPMLEAEAAAQAQVFEQGKMRKE